MKLTCEMLDNTAAPPYERWIAYIDFNDLDNATVVIRDPYHKGSIDGSPRTFKKIPHKMTLSDQDFVRLNQIITDIDYNDLMKGDPTGVESLSFDGQVYLLKIEGERGCFCLEFSESNVPGAYNIDELFQILKQECGRWM